MKYDDSYAGLGGQERRPPYRGCGLKSLVMFHFVRHGASIFVGFFSGAYTNDRSVCSEILNSEDSFEVHAWKDWFLKRL